MSNFSKAIKGSIKRIKKRNKSGGTPSSIGDVVRGKIGDIQSANRDGVKPPGGLVGGAMGIASSASGMGSVSDKRTRNRYKKTLDKIFGKNSAL